MSKQLSVTFLWVGVLVCVFMHVYACSADVSIHYPILLARGASDSACSAQVILNDLDNKDVQNSSVTSLL